MTVDAEALRRRLRTEGRLVLALKITPKAPRTEWAGALEDGTLKVRVAAAPERGKANEELRRFLSQELGAGAAQVTIVTGASSPRKQVRVTWVPEAPAP